MSFSPHEGDNVMTLHEALAFLEPIDDIFGISTTLPPLDEIDALLGPMIEFPSEETKNHAQNPPTRKRRTSTKTKKNTTGKKKRVRSPASSSTVLQRRKKAEILALREESTALQKALNQLLSSDTNAAIVKLNAKMLASSKAQGEKLPRWHQSALEQYEKRDKSHKLNLQLKELLSQQWGTSESLRGILLGQSLVQDMDYLMKQESIHGPLADNDVSRSMAQLGNAVENLYQHSTPILRLASSLLSSMQTSYKEQRKGDGIEFIVCTPMSCSMADASNVVWSHFKNDQPPWNKPNVLHNTVTVTLHHLGHALQFDKMHFFRKFSEPEQTTLVYTDLILLRSKGLKFCSNGFTTITPLPDDPLHTCVVQSVFTLCGDNDAGRESSLIHDVALVALGKAIRLFWQSEQSRLVDESARISGKYNYFSL